MSENLELSDLVCQEHRQGCNGPVEMRLHSFNDWKSFPRCEFHWEQRLEEQERINRLYAPNSDVPPIGFDPAAAGEVWDDRDY